MSAGKLERALGLHARRDCHNIGRRLQGEEGEGVLIGSIDQSRVLIFARLTRRNLSLAEEMELIEKGERLKKIKGCRILTVCRNNG